MSEKYQPLEKIHKYGEEVAAKSKTEKEAGEIQEVGHRR
jgi:hypothetical protein